MFGRFVCAGALGATLFLASGITAGATQRGACSTSGLGGGTARYKVVDLSASGVGCTKARSVAKQVADELAHGRPISLRGVQGFAINSTSCTGCKTTTQVALTYASGRVTISLGGKPSTGSAPTPIAPVGVGPLTNA